MKNIILLFLCFFLFVSCKKGSPEQPIVENEVIEIEKDFVDFYETFHIDSIFQLSSINFPLHAPGDSITWTEHNWILHKPFDDFDGKFRREFTPAGKIMLERIYDANGFFNMHRRWAKLTDGWKLMYYKIDAYNPPEQE